MTRDAAPADAVTVRRTLPTDHLRVLALLELALGWRPEFPSFREGYAAILNRRNSVEGGAAGQDGE